jgi:hypothetical protein
LVEPACWWCGTNRCQALAGLGSSARDAVEAPGISTCAIRSPAGDATGSTTQVATLGNRPPIVGRVERASMTVARPTLTQCSMPMRPRC